MIVDCHTHIWASTEQLGADGREFIRRQCGDDSSFADVSDHAVSARLADKTLVLGLRSRHLGINVPNHFISDQVARNMAHMIGIAAIDPTEDDALDQASQLLAQPEFRGLTISPAYQNFHPCDSRAMPLYEMASQAKVPVFVYHGSYFPAQSHMEFARPSLLDQVATEFPDLTLVISSMGLPWIPETVALLAKHPHVYADVAALVRRPWQAYNAFVMAHQYHVMDKVLFGSDFPFMTVAEAIESVFRLYEVSRGTNLPTVPREVLRTVVERDTLNVLGIARGDEITAAQQDDQ